MENITMNKYCDYGTLLNIFGDLFFSALPNKVKNFITKYMCDTYLGSYLGQEITGDQLIFDKEKGKCSVRKVELNVIALNGIADQLNLPFIFIDAFVDEINFLVKKQDVNDDLLCIEICGLKLTLIPKQRDEAISVIDSMMDSMSASMHIVHEIKKKSDLTKSSSEKPHDSESFSENNMSDFGSIDAISQCKKYVESMLHKIKVRFLNSHIRIESSPKSSFSGIALELKVDYIEYFDEEVDQNENENNKKCSVDLSSLRSKNFLIKGLSIFTDEFPIPDLNTSDILNSEIGKTTDLEISDDEFHDTLNNSTLNHIDNSNSYSDETFESSDSENLEVSPNQNLVLIGKLYGEQEIKVQLRKADTVLGPKVKIEMNLGCLIAFLSPRQIHLILELIEGINSPETVTHSKVVNKKAGDLQKPMSFSDFKTIDRDVIKQVSIPNLVPSHALNNREGWSSPHNWDNDFFPFTDLKENSTTLANSTLTDISDFESSFISTTSSHTNSNKKEDILTYFKIRLNSFCFIILQDDVIIPSHDAAEVVTESSIKEMQRKVDSFFSHMRYDCHSKNSFQNFQDLREKAFEAYLDSHIRFVGAGIVIEGNEKLHSNNWNRKSNILMELFEIKECLTEADQDSTIYSDLLVFKNIDSLSTVNHFQLTTNPKVQISIDQYETIQNLSKSRKVSSPKLDVQITLDDCLIEIDISLLDRINLLLNKQNVIIKKDDYIPPEKLPPSHLDNQAFFKEIMEENSKPDTKTNIMIESSHITMKVFFPIPDLRPLSDMNRVPWWKRNVRKEVMWIYLDDFNFRSNICAKYPTNFDILSNDIQILFQETKDLIPVPILRASSARDENEFCPVKICVRSFPVKMSSDLDDELMSEQDMNKSRMEFLSEMDKGAANLFKKRSVASKNQDIMNELTIPSDQEEMNKFINETLNNVQFDIQINLTDVKLILPSKHVYEIIYNRIVSDLLLWTPSAPKCVRVMPSLSSLNDFSIGTTLIPESYNPVSEFKPFTSMKNEDIYCSNYDDQFTSVFDQSYLNPKSNITKRSTGQTLFGIQVSIVNAAGSIHTPYRDENDKIILDKYGDISFLFEKGYIFVASGYKGDIDALQGCITLNTIHVYHKPYNIKLNSPISLNAEFPLTIKKLDNILYPSDSPCRIGGGNASFYRIKDCVNLCFKSSFDLLKNEKIFEVAGNLYCLTLRYFITNTSESWVSQIQDMFNVEDYPVEGYTIPDCITEINFHFEFCGIDYRPLYLPLRSYIALDSLAISSNFTVKGSSSVMMFFVEDAALFLSQNLVSKKVNLQKNYVCIIDVGTFELCIKMNYSSLNIPLTELLISNNIINIRTCADSCKAFMELLIYFSSGGDLVQEPSTSKCDSQTKKVVIEPSFTEEIAHSQHNQNTVINEHAVIASNLMEAMMESAPSDKSHDVSTLTERDANVDVFFFPGENGVRRESANTCLKPSSQLDLENALKEAVNEDFSTSTYIEKNLKINDEEFCVLEDIPGSGIQSPTGRPKARHIRHEYVSIKDGYFDTSADCESRFTTTKHFAQPYCKYNLQNMSITWHIYGGCDFSADDNCNSDKNGNKFRNVKITSNSLLNSPEISNRGGRGLNVSFTKGDSNVKTESSLSLNRSSTIQKPNANVKWFAVGGPNRCHDTLMKLHLNKIKFKYEKFTNECPFVSRHDFTIHDIDIIDCLINSGMNKFLHQLNTNTYPKQTSSNMVQVKVTSRRSDPGTYETNLKISCRPIKLNIDQDALQFLCKFIGHLINIDRESEYGEEERPYSVQPTPLMVVKSNNDIHSANQDLYFNKATIREPENKQSNNAPVYFRNVVFSPDVPIKIDYNGKHIDINSQYGPIAGLFIGLAQLNNSEVTLKSIELKSGVLGVNKLITSLTNEWIQDIKQNQLSSIIGGVGPIHSFVTLIGGIKDLFWLPIEQYNKDGRVFKGIQKGTSSFTSSSAYAVLDLSARFVGTIQSAAETMYDMVSSGPSVKNRAYKTKKGKPKDIREGVTTAYGLVRNGLGDTASTLIKVATEEHSHKGVSGAVGGLLRQIPPSVVQPIIIASEATCTVIGGMTNQLVPNAGREAADKWKS